MFSNLTTMDSTMCKICGSGKASNHYGGRCCLRCKAYFRRAVKSNVKYKCASNNNCEINESGRKCCKACRYKRSLAAGLDPNLIHYDRCWDSDYVANKSLSSESDSPQTSIDDTVSLIEMNKVLSQPFDGPLACKSSLSFSPTNDFRSFLKYFNAVDRFVDEFHETGFNHAGDFKDFNVNLSVQEAFMYSPRRLSSRTKILWQANNWVTVEAMSKIFCRTMVHYIDLASHIPELQLLEQEDKLRVLISRSMTFSGLTSIHRTLKCTKQKCVLISGGLYLPMEPTEIEQFKAAYAGNKYMTEAAELAVNVFDTFIGPMRELNLTDDEFVLLRFIAFFVPSQKLSPHAREVIRSAQSYYQSLLVEYLKANYDRSQALKRLGEILTFLPIIENHVAVRDNRMIAAMLFNTGLKGTLTHDFYIARTLRD
ncbi:hypothetical protein M3Y94_00682500 [Aphelenchoides besseyi]|nr:hypothetical protein M3Y94_00682500 [Aphelenchoides besseyi]KAI6231444.1 hypothetical protein M3Y95_00382400 [Aphelenchoides besseyi]